MAVADRLLMGRTHLRVNPTAILSGMLVARMRCLFKAILDAINTHSSKGFIKKLTTKDFS